MIRCSTTKNEVRLKSVRTHDLLSEISQITAGPLTETQIDLVRPDQIGRKNDKKLQVIILGSSFDLALAKNFTVNVDLIS